jgi:hypothetical protein
MSLTKNYRALLVIAGIAAVIFLFATFSASRPHLRAGPGVTDYTSLIQAVAGLVAAVGGLFGAIGAIRKPVEKEPIPDPVPRYPTLFREAPRNYQGPTVTVEIYDGTDQYGQQFFRRYQCFAVE